MKRMNQRVIYILSRIFSGLPGLGPKDPWQDERSLLRVYIKIGIHSTLLWIPTLSVPIFRK